MNLSETLEGAPPRAGERYRLLHEAIAALADATTTDSVLATIAAQGVEIFGGSCVVHRLSNDARALVHGAARDRDPGRCRELTEAVSQPVSLSAPSLARDVHERGEPFSAGRIEVERLRPPQLPCAYLELARRTGIHSLLILPLRARGRSIAQLRLARSHRQGAPFDEQDLDVARVFASQAALSLANAQLVDGAARENEARALVTRRLEILAEASREFSASTSDYRRLLEAVARRLGETCGDMCVIRIVSRDGAWLEPADAAFHRDPALRELVDDFTRGERQRIGEGLSGRVAASGKPVVTHHASASEFAALVEPRHRAFIEHLGATSSLNIPLVSRGAVVGVANLLRRDPQHPYDEDEIRWVRGVAEHAALAIGNALSFAAERAARDAAEQATSALRRANARYDRLSTAGVIGILVSDLRGEVHEVNDELLRIIGYSRDEILSGAVPWGSLTPPEWLGVDKTAIEELATSGVGRLREKEYFRKDGSRIPVLAASASLEGPGGDCISFVLDLTERKAAQAAMVAMREERAADTSFRRLLETAPDAMVVVGGDGKIVFTNGRVEALFGYAREELTGQPVELLVPERFRGAHPGRRAGYLVSPSARLMGSGLDLYGRKKDGTEFAVEISLSPLETDSGLLVSSAIRDVTERKRVERQHASLAAVVAASDDAIIGKTMEGVITSWNQGAHHLFGYTAEEIVGRSIALLIPPERESEEPAILEALARGEVKRFDTVRRRKDGTEVEVSVTSSPIRDPSGRIVGIAKVAHDITARSCAEKSLARAKEIAEGASRELESFSYAVAHDLRAPLRGMGGFARILLDNYGDELDEEGQDCLREILGNAQRMALLIDALLSLSRVTRNTLTRESVDLSALVRSTCGLLRAKEEEARSVVIAIEDDLHADLDPVLARALLENLLRNAWKFTSKVPNARIEFGATVQNGARTFYLRDNGAGFDMAYASKLFAPFQRLHSGEEFPGTGIGLATAQRIVRRHGGRIWAEGAVDQGATFYFSFDDAAVGTLR